MKTLAILYICTGPYAVFWHDFYPNFKANFLPDCDRTFYVFTDAAHIDYEDAPDVRRIYQKALPWPQSTMLRFDAFLGQADALQGYDYLFFANEPALHPRHPRRRAAARPRRRAEPDRGLPPALLWQKSDFPPL